MNVTARKLVFNEMPVYLIQWKGKPCFFVTELSNAIESIGKDDMSVFLRYGGEAVKGLDYDVVQGDEARDLRNYLEDCGVKKRFAHTMLIYISGLLKYFDFRRTVELKDFKNYLIKSKVMLDEPIEVPKEQNIISKSVHEEKISTDNAAYRGYSEFIKHISFMEDFVNTFNKISISSDNSVAFTKSIAKYLEDNGVQPDRFLLEIKKWIV
ncbi:MAG: hypothetical protein ACOZCL_16295 [Bacillota bacterium]